MHLTHVLCLLLYNHIFQSDVRNVYVNNNSNKTSSSKEKLEWNSMQRKYYKEALQHIPQKGLKN